MAAVHGLGDHPWLLHLVRGDRLWGDHPYSPLLNVLIIECSITFEDHTMFLNSVMLKSLNELQTICQITTEGTLLKSDKFVSDNS